MRQALWIVVLAMLIAIPLPAFPSMQVSCQMLLEAERGWICPLIIPVTGRLGGELHLKLEYAQPLRTPITELWEVTTPSNESWQILIQGSSFGARGAIALPKEVRIQSGLWRAQPLGFSVTPVSARLTLSLTSASAIPVHEPEGR